MSEEIAWLDGAASAAMTAYGQDGSWRDVARAVGEYLGAMECTPLAAAEPDVRFALVEQMGFRRTYGTVRETEFCGRPMIELTSLETRAVALVAPESLYQVTWLTREQAEAATRTGSHSPAALSAAIAEDLASWGADDEYGDAEETAAILADPATMAAIAEGEADL